MRITVLLALLLSACAADDVELDQSGSLAALPLTKRQAAEVLIRAGCTRTAYCNHRDAHLVGHHVPAEGDFVDACVAQNVRAYCHEDPGYCGSLGFPGAELCESRDCDASTTTTLEGASACAAVADDDSQLCSEQKSPGCFYAILGLTPPF
jgi:hypothetical protein